jgi:hypothetical protein
VRILPINAKRQSQVFVGLNGYVDMVGNWLIVSSVFDLGDGICVD